MKSALLASKSAALRVPHLSSKHPGSTHIPLDLQYWLRPLQGARCARSSREPITMVTADNGRFNGIITGLKQVFGGRTGAAKGNLRRTWKLHTERPLVRSGYRTLDLLAVRLFWSNWLHLLYSLLPDCVSRKRSSRLSGCRYLSPFSASPALLHRAAWHSQAEHN